MTSVLACFSFVRSATAAPPETSSEPLTCALIDVDQSALAGLVEAELIVRPSEEWLERTEISRLLEEKQLQLLLAAEAGDDRVSLGQTLKADVLVLLRTTKQEQKTMVELVVAETDQGLRLLTESFELGQNLEEHAAAVVQLVDQALAKARQKIRHVFAVPPFVSDDLTYEYEYLKSTYAKLLEQSLLDSPGVLIVELEEARAIANELALTSESGTIKRSLPIYLLGQFRNEGKDDQRKVKLSLSVQQGAKELDKLQTELSPDAVAVYLRDTAAKIAQTQGIPTAKIDPSVEAEQLNKRAQQFIRLGDWAEAVGLLEASLMLHPDQPDKLAEAIKAAQHLSYTYNASQLDELAKATELNRRSLYFLQRIAAIGTLEQVVPHITMLQQPSRNVLLDHEDASLLLKQQIELEAAFREEKREFSMQLAQRFAEAGDWDSSGWIANMAWSKLTPEERYAKRLEWILEYQDRPATSRMVRMFTTGRYAVENLRTVEGRRFLTQLANHPDANETVQQTANEFLEIIGKGPKVRKVVTNGDPNNETQLTFERFSLSYENQSGTQQELKWFDGCVPVGDDIDLFYQYSGLFLFSEDGGLRQLWKAPPNTYVKSISYDGKYIWLAANVISKAAQVWVFDPKTEEGVQLLPADGLPLLSPDEIPGSDFFSPTVALTTVGEGRAIVSGHIGRTWLADVRFDPGGRHQVNLFHEAKQIVAHGDSEVDPRNVNIAFQPTDMQFHWLLSDDPKRKQSVVIGRHCPVYQVTRYPLIVDLDDLSVRACEVGWGTGSMRLPGSVTQNGAHYYIGPAPPKYDAVSLIRVGLPDFRAEIVMPNVPEGHLIYRPDGEMHSVGMQWQRGRLEDGELKSFGPVPWLFSNRYGASPQSANIYVDRGTFTVKAIADSNNFGMIASCSENEGPHGLVKVKFDGSGQTLKEALNGSQDEQVEQAEAKQAAKPLKVESRNLWERPPRCVSLAYSPDGRLIVTTSKAADEAVQVWNGEDGQLVANLMNDPQGVSEVVFSHNGKMFATGSMSGRVTVWDTQTLQPMIECKGEDDEIRALAFSWKDDRLAAASRGRTASVWSIPEGKRQFDFAERSVGINWLGFSANDEILITSSGTSTQTRSTNDGTLIGDIESISHVGGVLSDGSLIAIGDDLQNTLIKYKTKNGTAETLWPGMTGHPMAITPDGQLIANFFRDLYIDNQRKEIYRVEIWDLPSRTKLATVDQNIAEKFVFTPSKDALIIVRHHGGLQRVEIPRRSQRQIGPEQANVRTWTDSTGKHTREAIFQRSQGQQVQLKTSEGKTIYVPLDRLSSEDQKYVREQTQRETESAQ